MSNLEDWVKHGEEIRRPLVVNEDLGKSTKVVIVGGGLSGMACAYRIAKKRPDIDIIIHEKSNRLGGVIATWQEGEWICDLAVNATRPHPAFWRLIADLNLASKFSPSRPEATARWVLLNDKKHKLSWRTLFKIGPLKLRKSIKKSRIGRQSVSQVIPHKAIADALCLGIVNDSSENVDVDFLIPSLTKFGSNPPIKKSKLKSLIATSYPLFTPKRGSIASLKGGMQYLVETLAEELSKLSNISIHLGQEADNVNAVAKQYNVQTNSIIWAAPGFQPDYEATKLSIFAIGYRSDQVANVKIGYGTLIPDSKYPISGILHESDIHQSKRCPENYRLFRLMVPHNRWNGNEESVLSCAENLLASNPEKFVKIGEREIPRYKPGYMREIAQMNTNCTYIGWSVSGVSITHVIDEAERIAEQF